MVVVGFACACGCVCRGCDALWMSFSLVLFSIDVPGRGLMSLADLSRRLINDKKLFLFTFLSDIILIQNII